MGLFGNLFSSNKPKKRTKQLPWKQLTNIEQLNVIEKASKTKTQLLFKHSTRCGISKMVINQFVDLYDLDLNADLYYLDLLSHRDVSNEIAIKFQVLHQSPQLIVLKNEQTVAHASHGAINQLMLKNFV